MNWYGNGNGMMDNPGFAIFGMIFMVILFVVAVWVIVRIVEQHGSHNRPYVGNFKHSDSGPAALEVLDMRLAKGEISADEYLALKKHLS